MHHRLTRYMLVGCCRGTSRFVGLRSDYRQREGTSEDPPPGKDNIAPFVIEDASPNDSASPLNVSYSIEGNDPNGKIGMIFMGLIWLLILALILTWNGRHDEQNDE